MKYTLNTSVQFNQISEGLAIQPGTGEVTIIEEGIDEYLEFITLFLEPSEESTVYQKLNQRFYVSSKHFAEMMDFSIEISVLKQYKSLKDESPMLSDYHREKYDRQIVSFLAMTGVEMNTAVSYQEKLQNSKVVILGIGGTGGYMALSLASMGVGELVIVDHDIIELSNTSRQVLYDETNVGSLKIDVAAEKLKKYNRDLKLHTYNKRLQSDEDFDFLVEHKDAQLIILAADEPRGKITYMMDRAAHKFSIPWLFYGPYRQTRVTIGPLTIPAVTKSFEEIFPYDLIIFDERTEFINERNYASGIIDPFNGLASKMAAVEVLKFLSGYEQSAVINSRISLDTSTWSLVKTDY